MSIGKLAVYIAAAGLPPTGAPVMLDMGSDNLRPLNEEMYIGNRPFAASITTTGSVPTS
jgi:malate dehydrogenase (oxaloacetate-decarboxylating)